MDRITHALLLIKMAQFLSEAVLGRTHSLVGTPLQTQQQQQQQRRPLPMPYVKLKLREEYKHHLLPAAPVQDNNSTAVYLIETDVVDLATLVERLHCVYEPRGRLQGQAYSDRALVLRAALYYDPHVRAALDYFVHYLSATMRRLSLGKGRNIVQGRSLKRKEYVFIFSKIYRALVNDRLPRNDPTLKKELCKDYQADAYLSVRRLLFSLTDLWTENINALSYSKFLNSLLARIIDAETMTFRSDDSIRCDPNKYNSVKSWTHGYKVLKEENDQQVVQQVAARVVQHAVHHNTTMQELPSPTGSNQGSSQKKQQQRSLRETMKVELNIPIPAPIPAVSLSASKGTRRSSPLFSHDEMDIEEYMQMQDYFQEFELNEAVHLDDNVRPATNFVTIDSLSPSLPLSPEHEASHDTGGRSQWGSGTTDPTVNLTTNEHPIGMLHSLGLRARNVKQVRQEEVQVRLGKCCTRRMKTDLIVAMKHSMDKFGLD